MRVTPTYCAATASHNRSRWTWNQPPPPMSRECEMPSLSAEESESKNANYTTQPGGQIMPPKKSRKAAPATARRRRNKANPDEYRREGLVTVDHDSFSAMLFAPQELKTIEQTSPYNSLSEPVRHHPGEIYRPGATHRRRLRVHRRDWRRRDETARQGVRPPDVLPPVHHQGTAPGSGRKPYVSCRRR